MEGASSQAAVPVTGWVILFNLGAEHKQACVLHVLLRSPGWLWSVVNMISWSPRVWVCIYFPSGSELGRIRFIYRFSWNPTATNIPQTFIFYRIYTQREVVSEDQVKLWHSISIPPQLHRHCGHGQVDSIECPQGSGQDWLAGTGYTGVRGIHRWHDRSIIWKLHHPVCEGNSLAYRSQHWTWCWILNSLTHRPKKMTCGY